MKRGDIYYINRRNAGNTDSGEEQHSGRPAIIVSNDAYVEAGNTIQVVYLTTRCETDAPVNVDIRSTPQNSVALCGAIATVYKDLVSDYMCTCTPYEMMMVDVALAISLGLTLEEPKKKETPAHDHTKDPVTVAAVQPVAAVPDEHNNEVYHGLELLKLEIERDTYKSMYADLLDRFFKL